MHPKPLIAFDFDGVLCDSANETCTAAWKTAYQHFWPDLNRQVPDLVRQGFSVVRPALETGYEAVLIVKLLSEGYPAESLRQSLPYYLQRLSQQYQLDNTVLKQTFGQVRDDWISHHPEQWLQMNPLYPGVSNVLSQYHQDDYVIITTKQERFVHQILAANNIHPTTQQVFGLDRQCSKLEILQQLRQQHAQRPIHFIEDRLATLLPLQHNDALTPLTVSLATWGYNTPQDKTIAKQRHIPLLTLADLSCLMAN